MLPSDIFSRLEKILRLAGSGFSWIPLESIDATIKREIADNLGRYIVSTETAESPQVSSPEQIVEKPSPSGKKRRSAEPKVDRPHIRQISPKPPQIQAPVSDRPHIRQIPAEAPVPPDIGSSHDRELPPLQATSLDSLNVRIRNCQNCNLCTERRSIVFGQGNRHAKLLFVGDYPEEEDDRRGMAFIGRAGKLLTQMIHAIGINRDAVFLTSLLKCRPAAEYRLGREEVRACLPILDRQIALIEPAVLVTLGNLATKALIPEAKGIALMRGRHCSYRGIRVVPTYHPAYLFKRFSAAGQVWEDMQRIERLLIDGGPNEGRRKGESVNRLSTRR